MSRAATPAASGGLTGRRRARGAARLSHNVYDPRVVLLSEDLSANICSWATTAPRTPASSTPSKPDNSLSAEAAARELGRLSLADALGFLLLLAEKDPARFDPAAARWHARFGLEARRLRLADSQLLLGAVAGLRAPAPVIPLDTIHALADKAHLSAVAMVYGVGCSPSTQPPAPPRTSGCPGSCASPIHAHPAGTGRVAALPRRAPSRGLAPPAKGPRRPRKRRRRPMRAADV